MTTEPATAPVTLPATASINAGPWSGSTASNWWDGASPQAGNVTAIQADGWRATYTSPPTFDPVSSPLYTIVRRDGFDSDGAAIKVIDELLLMSRTRKPYPDQLTETTNDVALQDFVYSGDEIATDITNNSTRAAPLPLGLWLTPDLGIATSSTYTVRLAVAHAHARSGRPVAAVKFIATDQHSNSVSVTVSALSTITYTASGLTVPHFTTALNLSTLDALDMITVDAVIYPWVGAAFTLSTDASTYPSVNLSVLKFLNDKSDTYGTAYAYVDPGGNDGTGVTSETPGTAQATPYLTIAAAATGIKTYNNANFSRNNASGGFVRLEVGTYTHSTFGAVSGGPIPLVIEAENVANKATTIWQDAGENVFTGMPDHLKVKDITLRKTAAVIFFSMGALAGVDDVLIFENCTFDINAQAVTDIWLIDVGRVWFIECDGDECGQSRDGGNEFKAVVTIGSAIGLTNGTYHAAGSTYTGALSRLQGRPAGIQSPAVEGQFFGWNFMSNDQLGGGMIRFAEVIGDRGIALIGNVFEMTVDAGTYFLNDLPAIAMQNAVVQCNTAPGGRVFFGYQDSGSTEVAKSGAVKFCVLDEYNSKSDVFGTNANLVGNWSLIYKVGFMANTFLYGDSGGDAFGVGEWAGEIGAIGSLIGTDATPIVADWVSDKSFKGDGAGDGNYTPGGSNALSLIPSGLAPYSHDQKGNVIPNDGTGVAGAIQE